jgi:phosphopantetheinyl transferase (holo-ACP synthase)
MIGNDLVDLEDSETRPEERHERFDERVFCTVERESIGASGAPDRLRWILWAAKEAAYKVARKADERAVFSPPRFQVHVDATLRGRVHFAGRDYALLIDEAPGRVHAVASEKPWESHECLSRVITWDAEAQLAGKAVRALARREIAAALDLPAEELEIEREGRIPVLSLGGRPLDVDLSLTHHGRFLAFACDLRDGAAAWRRRRSRRSSSGEAHL